MKKVIATILIVLMLMVNNSMVIAINEVYESVNNENTQSQENSNSEDIAEKSDAQEQENTETYEQTDTNVQSQEENDTYKNSDESQDVDTIDASSMTKLTATQNDNILPYGNGIYRISIASPEYCHLALEIKDASKDVTANVKLHI